MELFEKNPHESSLANSWRKSRALYPTNQIAFTSPAVSFTKLYIERNSFEPVVNIVNIYIFTHCKKELKVLLEGTTISNIYNSEQKRKQKQISNFQQSKRNGYL